MSADVLLSAAWVTILAFVCSLAVATLGGLLVAAAQLSGNVLLTLIGRIWVGVWRGVPPLVWLFAIYFGITVSGRPLTVMSAAVLGFGMIGSAYLGEAFRAGVESIPRGQFEAISALGMPGFASLTRIVLPQAMPIAIAGSTAYAINLLKETSLASLIGLQEITFVINAYVARGYDGMVLFMLAGAAYLVLSLVVGLFGRGAAQLVSRRFGLVPARQGVPA